MVKLQYSTAANLYTTNSKCYGVPQLKKLIPPTTKQEEIEVLQAGAIAHAQSKRLPG